MSLRRRTTTPTEMNGAAPDIGGLMIMVTSTLPPTEPTTRPDPTLPTFLLCEILPYHQYEALLGTIASLCACAGVLYLLFGYRYFRTTMFLTGFLFGSLVTYMICLEENLLPREGKLGVAAGAGILCGLITMLVQYVGVFMTGFHFGFLCATAGLVISALVVPPSTKWIPIGAILGTGVVFALLGLYFQRGITILSTSATGTALLATAADYFLHLYSGLWLVVERLRAEISGVPICWLAWIILGVAPAVWAVGVLVQWKVTAKGYDHKKAYPRRRLRSAKSSYSHGNGRHNNSAPVSVSKPAAAGAGRHVAGQQLKPAPNTSSYRHLYQVRRYNGDVIAQNYVCSIQGVHYPPASRHH